MANKRLDYDKIYELVMQCRQSGLSDKQWCLDNNIAPSTFYYWIRRLQQKACYDLTEAASRRDDVPAVAVKQDVVCVNIQPDPATKVNERDLPDYPDSANVMLQYGNVRIALSDEFNEQTLKRVLLTLRETVC